MRNEYENRYFGEEGPLAHMGPLFDPRKDHTLTTRLPPKMVPTMLRLGLISAAIDPNREDPLIDIFRHNFNNTMIGMKGEGRVEWLAAVRASSEMEAMDHGEL